MSHIHVPDGVLPFWLWFSGYIILLIYLWFFHSGFKKMHLNKKLPLVGVLSALMLVSMSIEIFAYHVNLATLAGILLGPWLAVLSIFIVNIILAFLGHGGVTVIALNTIVVSIEAIVGYFLFKTFFSKTGKIFRSAFCATFIALFISAWSTVGVVYLGTNNLEYLTHDEHHSAEIHKLEKTEHPHLHMHTENQQQSKFDIKKFIVAILALGLIGWTFESFVTAFIINYIYRIKPDIIENETEQSLNTVEKE